MLEIMAAGPFKKDAAELLSSSVNAFNHGDVLAGDASEACSASYSSRVCG